LAHFLHPFSVGEEELSSQNSGINESCLVDTMRRNSVAFKFKRRIEMDLVLKQKIFTAFPRLKAFLDDLELKREKDSLAFSQIGLDFSENGIDFLLIKSDGSFPYESDNIDVLIEPKMLVEVSKLLKKAGYSELAEIREPHKFLFRNTRAYDVLPLHIHTRVEWAGTQFVDSQDLWSRSEISSEGGFCFPSPEDCILITVAHLFFENHEVKLADLFKIASRIRDYDLDWDYTIEHSKRLCWDDAFYLSMFLVDLVYESLFGKRMLEQSILSRIRGESHSYVALLQKTMKPFSSEYMPLEIPYNFAVVFLLRRVLCDISSSLSQRLNHLIWIASDVLRRRVLWPNYSAHP
jgi:hypothetical protein